MMEAELMIFVECRECDGMGKQHSPGCNGDPMDEGVPCWKCKGDGGWDEDIEDEAE